LSGTPTDETHGYGGADANTRVIERRFQTVSRHFRAFPVISGQITTRKMAAKADIGRPMENAMTDVAEMSAQVRKQMPTSSAPLRQAITRPQLRKIVPLGDTTIWEMEQRNEFPRRFFLTSRCVAWDFQEVQDWLAARMHAAEEGRVKRAPAPDVGRRRTRPVRR
jgi:prophage regulatory protein